MRFSLIPRAREKILSIEIPRSPFLQLLANGRDGILILEFARVSNRANFRSSPAHAAHVVETADVVWGSAKFKERRTRRQENVENRRWRRCSRYPEIGMSSLARNFAPIVVSYLFAWESILFSTSFPFSYSFFLFLSLPSSWPPRRTRSSSLARRDNSSLNYEILSLQHVINFDSTDK